MKSWKTKLNLSDIRTTGLDLPVPELLKIRDRVLAIDPEAEFREAQLSVYDESMLESSKDRQSFLEDMYDWADNNDIWVIHG